MLSRKPDDTNLILEKLNLKSAFIFVSPILGGHEKMAINIIKKFNMECNIDIYVPKNNEILKKELQLNNLHYEQHNVIHKRIEIIHSFFNLSYRQRAKELLRKLNQQYDSIVIVQGDIELGSVFLLIAKKLKIKIISYIPYAHSFKKMGARLSFVKDLLSNLIYRSCDCFITIAPNFQKQLNIYNSNAEVFVLENFLTSMCQSINKKQQVNSDESINLFMIGRVHFLQKGHDILIEALSITENSIGMDKDIVLHIIGDGPDLDKLKELVNHKLSKINVIFHGWLTDVWSLSIRPDLVVIPSNFEGVPLVMLEALERNIPIIAARIDGMLDYLPNSYLYSGQTNQEKIINLSLLLDEFFNNHKNNYQKS